MEPNSFKEFKTIIGRSAGTMPMTSNLYQVNLSAPPIFRKGGSGIYDPVKEIEAERTIDYYANSITLPSRAVTTGELNNVGQIRRFATGQTASEINIQFILTKDQRHRYFFEQWLNHTASDSDNTVGFYDDYVVDMEILKFENGPAGHQQTAAYKLLGAFPFNVGQLELNNEQTNLVQLDVAFYFERYRMDQTMPQELRAKPSKFSLKDLYSDTSIPQFLDTILGDFPVNGGNRLV